MTEAIAGVQIPDTELAQAATVLAREANDDPLVGDSLSTTPDASSSGGC